MYTTTHTRSTSPRSDVDFRPTMARRTRANAMFGAFLALAAEAALAQFDAIISPVGLLNTNAETDERGDFNPQVATDGHGNWVAVWRSEEDDIAGGIGPDADILVTRSVDNGMTWTPPAPLNSSAAGDTGGDFNPIVATDGHGHWVAVWNSNDPDFGGVVGMEHDVLVARSTDNGATWTDAAALNSNAGTDNGSDLFPQIATDGQGNWVAVWQSAEPNIASGIGPDTDVLVSRSMDHGASWSDPVPLNSNAGGDTRDDERPAILTDGQGTWLGVWSSNEADIAGGIGTDFDVLTARSTDHGETWTDPVPLNNNAADDDGDEYEPQLASDGHGNWVAVWWSNEPDIGGDIGDDFDILVARSASDGESWTDPAPLHSSAATDSGFDGSPRVANDGDGNWIVVWYSEEPDIAGATGDDDDTVVAHSSDNGATWTDPAPLNTNAGSDTGVDEDPHVATDRRGNWVAVWRSTEPNIASGIGTDNDVLTAHFALPDCNMNGVGDGQDIADGASEDCNGNGVPDECDTDGDRDGDGVFDRCEACPDDPLKFGPGDCGCGVPDDADGDGFPDCLNLIPGGSNNDNNTLNPGNSDTCGCGNGMLAMLPVTLLGCATMRRRAASERRRR